MAHRLRPPCGQLPRRSARPHIPVSRRCGACRARPHAGRQAGGAGLMATKRAEEIRPGMWIQRQPGTVEKVSAVNFKPGDLVDIVTATVGSQLFTRSYDDTIEVAATPPEADMVWDAGDQLWRLSINTSVWPNRVLPLEVLLDGEPLDLMVHGPEEVA